ncbi:MAG: AbrB/MazE/SpoVT family DNA-binding domain-containing protein [Geodermatophilaceae bacterium]|nr:AbrB/MazE/SpoVT family DNA-binding domain-containing protein [Geodermatophilaceae bacterium]
MPTATVTSKGQITIPAEVRKTLGLKSGSRVDFVRVDSGAYELVPTMGSVRSLKGCVPRPAKPVTLEQMERAIAAAATEGTLG